MEEIAHTKHVFGTLMNKPTLALDTPEKYDRFIELMRKTIARDCTGGREFLAKEKAPGGRAAELDPKVLETIEKNIDIREGVLNELIKSA